MVPSPIAIQRFPSHVISFPPPLKILVLVEIIVHVIPSVEYAIGGPPNPTATQRSLFQAIPAPSNIIIVAPIPVHVRPSFEYAIVFVPDPTATNLRPL